MLIYAIENYINADSSLYANSEDGTYVLENLFNERPSFPYRTTDIGMIGSPEWICIDIGSAQWLTFAAIFNHNLTQLETAGDELRLKGCDDPCDGSAACDWDNPGCEKDLTALPSPDCEPSCSGTQPVENFCNLYHTFNCDAAHQYWRLDMIDQANTDGFLEVGELFLGQWQYFGRGSLTNSPNWVRLTPGRDDGPVFNMNHQLTYAGQDWINYHSDAEGFTLSFTNLNDPCIVDELQVFLRTVMRAGGKFVIVPDDAMPFCYYVAIMNKRDFAHRTIYGLKELREWRLELKTLVEGITLL